MNPRKSLDLKTAFAFLWMIFTIALAVWLLVFQSHLFDQLQSLTSPEARLLERHHRMVTLEMTTMIVALLIGGVSLFYLIWLERRHNLQIQQFFSIFTHELKTSLARLRLQAESIQADPQKANKPAVTFRLLEEVRTLEMHLENSLWVARADLDKLVIEPLDFSKFLAQRMPSLDITLHLAKPFSLKVDRRALESIVKNIIQNSVLHGQANNLWIEASNKSDGFLQIEFRDDGKGFDGPLDALGKIFSRASIGSGTGLGLYLVAKLCTLHGGTAEFVPTTQGFKVVILLPGSLGTVGKESP